MLMFALKFAKKERNTNKMIEELLLYISVSSVLFILAYFHVIAFYFE